MILQSKNHLPLLLAFHKGGSMTVIRLQFRSSSIFRKAFSTS